MHNLQPGPLMFYDEERMKKTLLESLEFPADFPAESGEISAGNTFRADFAED
jgi:hypothetical protein